MIHTHDVQLSALVEGKWVPQGEPIPDYEFTALNDHLEPADKLRILTLKAGDSVILNEGCHGTFKIERPGAHIDLPQNDDAKLVSARRYAALHEKFNRQPLPENELDEMRRLRRYFGTLKWNHSAVLNYIRDNVA